ncbi:uncharacterized protein LOC114249069 [Bombyx mandarina]|uniref:Uncharacterized protein LOC114249069 n=1 Tax=Bombyx mandarina TaxID=7092 RepID=A0A6J2KDJ0_BOMMA|nr:uncharacterized protein LOC114249069 [Bombyx mandarina]
MADAGYLTFAFFMENINCLTYDDLNNYENLQFVNDKSEGAASVSRESDGSDVTKSTGRWFYSIDEVNAMQGQRKKNKLSFKGPDSADRETVEKQQRDFQYVVMTIKKLNADVLDINNRITSLNRFIDEKLSNVIVRRSAHGRLKRDLDSASNLTAVKTDANVTKSSGRKSMNAPGAPNILKEKLLSYLDDAFGDIKNKMAVLNVVKMSYKNNGYFKIGYITASLDTLKVYLDNMKQDMNANKEFWDDKRVLNLFDKLKAADNAVNGLLETLKLKML